MYANRIAPAEFTASLFLPGREAPSQGRLRVRRVRA